VDPFIDSAPIRLLVRDVVADYSKRSLSSARPPAGDPAAGPERPGPAGRLRSVEALADDPEVEEIWVNAPDRVFIARRCRSELTTTILGAGQLADLAERMLRSSGRRIDMSTPMEGAHP
jgi:pilus assembly protein CpaF